MSRTAAILLAAIDAPPLRSLLHRFIFASASATSAKVTPKVLARHYGSIE